MYKKSKSPPMGSAGSKAPSCPERDGAIDSSGADVIKIVTLVIVCPDERPGAPRQWLVFEWQGTSAGWIRFRPIFRPLIEGRSDDWAIGLDDGWPSLQEALATGSDLVSQSGATLRLLAAMPGDSGPALVEGSAS